MKGHHKHRKATGGAASGDAAEGEKDYEKDLKSKPERYNQSKVESEAEEKKHGGRAKRKHGGRTKHKHHEKMGELKHAHHIGHVHGHKGHHRGKKARGGSTKTGSNFNPLSSAHSGSAPSGHKTTDID